MPTMPKEAALPAVLPGAITVLNAIHSDASDMYQKYVPTAIDENITEVGNVVLNNEAVRNEFVSGLWNKIGMTFITSKSYQNKLAFAKQGILAVGESVEEIAINLIPEQAYDIEYAEDIGWKRFPPDVRSAFHRVNRKGFFPLTIQLADLELAFQSVTNFNNFLTNLMGKAYDSDNFSEFLYTKDIFRRAGNNGDLAVIQVTNPIDEASAKEFMVELRTTSNDMEYIRDGYNGSGILTHSAKSEQFIFVLSRIEARITVDVLASAFNRDDANYTARVITVDDFGGLEKQGVIALIVDKQFLKIWDKYLAVTSNTNGAGPYTTWYLHHHQILSYSPFVNGIALTTTPGTVTSLTITPDTATVSKASTEEIRFIPTFEGTGVFTQSINWTVSGNVPTGAKITTEGKLVIPRNDPAVTLTVTATAIADNTKTDTATITLT